MLKTQIGQKQAWVYESGPNFALLMSYQTAVAIWKDGKFYRTAEYWSITTTKHIGIFGHSYPFKFDEIITKPQKWFDGQLDKIHEITKEGFENG